MCFDETCTVNNLNISEINCVFNILAEQRISLLIFIISFKRHVSVWNLRSHHSLKTHKATIIKYTQTSNLNLQMYECFIFQSNIESQHTNICMFYISVKHRISTYKFMHVIYSSQTSNLNLQITMTKTKIHSNTTMTTIILKKLIINKS